MSKKPTVLMILDGFGLNETADGNAVAQANTPVLDKLMTDYPFVKGYASGLAVGLPDGQMGNSEVGHLNMGAGRIVYQELKRTSLICICSDWYPTGACIVIIRIFMVFWSWRKKKDCKTYMCIVLWMDGILRRRPAKDLFRSCAIRCRRLA